MTDARAALDGLFRALPLGGKSFALLCSVSAHALVVLAFSRTAPHVSSPTEARRDALVEIAAFDLALADAPAQPVHPQSALLAPHSHPYPVPPGHDVTPHDPSLRHDQPAPSAGSAAPVAEPAAAPAVIDSPSLVAPRFVMTVGSASHTPGATSIAEGRAATPSTHPEAPGTHAGDEPVPEARVDTAASLVAGNSASYTREAEAAGVEADVPLEIVVNGAGAVVGARALAHVGYGLDEAALQSVRAYRFSPARRAGKALAVRMRWVMRFRLR